MGQRGRDRIAPSAVRPAPPAGRLAPGAGTRAAPSAARGWLAAAGWAVGAAALFVLLLRISRSVPLDSDSANNALQAWDILHGNLLLHGWILGDATYYTSQLPLYLIAESILGLSPAVPHVVAAAVYLLVVACAIMLARAGSHGVVSVVRGAVVLAVLAVPLLNPAGVELLLEKPDHIGTTAILMGSFLLIDRAAGRRFAPPVLCAILALGQVADATVPYIAVPAVLAVYAYRRLVARTADDQDTAIALAAVVSVPLGFGLRELLVHLGGFLMVPPITRLAPPSLIPPNLAITSSDLKIMFGAIRVPGSPLGVAGAVLGAAALLAAGVGAGRVAWTWRRRASRAEQLLFAAGAVNVALYVFSRQPYPNNAREIIFVLPMGAVLAARALAPADQAGRARRRLVGAAAAVAGGLALVSAATVPAAQPPPAPLAAWLKAHHLRYGIAGYWSASSVTMLSDQQVRVRAVTVMDSRLAARDWETKASWYDRSRYRATFAIADPRGANIQGNSAIGPATFEKYLGRPVASYRVAGKIVLIYGGNLLSHVTPALRTWQELTASHKPQQAAALRPPVALLSRSCE